MSEPRIEALRSLLTFPCDCSDDWTLRGRHAPDCRHAFVRDFLDEADIAAILDSIRSEAGPVDVELLRKAVAQVNLGAGGHLEYEEAIAAEYARLSEEPGNKGEINEP